jgi:hypothetical protein
MKISRSLVVLAGLGVAILLSGCERKQLVGKTTDVFGRPLAGVSVKIEKTEFQASSKSDGSYALDYAPGSFVVVFSKAGYTTMHLDLNVAQLTRMPLETVMLYPVPEQAGVYLLGPDGLTPLAEARMRQTMQRNTFGGDLRVSVPTSSTVTATGGRIRFIDTDPRHLLLAAPDRSGLFYEAAFIFLASNVKIRRLVDTSTEEVGAEKLQVRSATLQPGQYAFVEMIDNQFQGAQPGKACFPFQVAGTSTSPSPARP